MFNELKKKKKKIQERKKLGVFILFLINQQIKPWFLIGCCQFTNKWNFYFYFSFFFFLHFTFHFCLFVFIIINTTPKLIIPDFMDCLLLLFLVLISTIIKNSKIHSNSMDFWQRSSWLFWLLFQKAT